MCNIGSIHVTLRFIYKAILNFCSLIEFNNVLRGITFTKYEPIQTYLKNSAKAIAMSKDGRCRSFSMLEIEALVVGL